MATLVQLWLPILVSGVLVFFASSVIHMVLRYHASDCKGFTNEDAVRTSVRGGAQGPGQDPFPFCKDMKEMGNPEMQRKFEEGPVGVVWLKKAGPMSMGPHLLKWLGYCVVVGFFCAYVASIALPRGVGFATVFRVVGTVAFLAYAGSKPADTIWMGKPVSCLSKDVLDGLIYGLVTGATFGWLWPGVT